MKLKKKNKGFSLVELIVVMAIMAILAVTLAPTLTQYVEKSRKAADKEVINSIYTAAEYALLDDKINTDALTLTALTASSGLSLNLNPLTGAPDVTLARSGASEMYIVSGKAWTANIRAESGDTPYTNRNNAFVKEIYNVVGNFKLKSNAATEDTDIVIKLNSSTKELSVELQYTGAPTTDDYKVTSAEVR